MKILTIILTLIAGIGFFGMRHILINDPIGRSTKEGVHTINFFVWFTIPILMWAFMLIKNRTNIIGPSWINLDNIKATFKKEKWYNNNWIIGLCILVWPLCLFLTIRKILIHYEYYNPETKRFQKSNKQEKKSKNESLEKLRELQIISESEYRSKKENLNKQQKKTEIVDALIKAKADGLLTDEEYQIKLKSLEGNTESKYSQSSSK